MAFENLHPSQRELLSFFAYDHLPPHLQTVSRSFSDLAHILVVQLGDSSHGAELTVALRKLLESKDAAVRAALGVQEKPAPEDAA